MEFGKTKRRKHSKKVNSNKEPVASMTPQKVKSAALPGSSRLTPSELESLKQLSKDRGSELEQLLGLQPCE